MSPDTGTERNPLFFVAEMTHRRTSVRPGGQSTKHLVDILSSIQFDHWILSGSTPDISLMSHADKDHNPQECVSYPSPIIVAQRNIGELTGDIISIPQDTFWQVGNLLFYYFVSARIRLQHASPPYTDFHSDWWYVISSKYPVGLLFVGDLDYPEIPILEHLIEYVLKSGRPLHAILLPSYGGVTTHKVPSNADPRALGSTIGSLAQTARANGLKLGALPHPITATWTDFEFLRLPQKSQIL